MFFQSTKSKEGTAAVLFIVYILHLTKKIEIDFKSAFFYLYYIKF